MVGRAQASIFPEILWPGIVAALLVFALCAYSAFFLYGEKVFNQENVIFGSDPYFRSWAFAEGWGERSLIHPNLSNFVNPPVRVVAALARPFTADSAPQDLRMRIGLLVSPLFAALAALTIYMVASLGGLTAARALCLSLLFGLSMSTVAFGSVPDHFLISSFILTAAIWLMQWDGAVPDPWRFRVWALLGTAAAGVTISNAVPLVLVFLLDDRLRRGRWRQAVSRAALLGAVIMVATAGLWGIANWVYGDFSSLKADYAYDKNIGRIGHHMSDDPVRDFLSFPIAAGQAFAGGVPKVVSNPPYPKEAIARYGAAFSYGAELPRPGSWAVFQMIPAVLIALSLYLGFRRRRDECTPVAFGAAAFLAFNWLLHSFWGEEHFLFSPHWHFASVLALVPLLRRYTGTVSMYLIPLAVGLVLGFNLWVWRDMLLLVPTLAWR